MIEWRGNCEMAVSYRFSDWNPNAFQNLSKVSAREKSFFECVPMHTTQKSVPQNFHADKLCEISVFYAV